MEFSDLEKSLSSHLYWLFNCCNAIVNVFVYSLRHEEIRLGLKLLFTCKELPSQTEKRLQQEYRISLTSRAEQRCDTISPNSPPLTA